MGVQPGRRRTGRRNAAVIVAPAIAALVIAAGCTVVVPDADDVPYDVSASDGAYGDRVAISWSAPETELEIDGYRVERAPASGVGWSEITTVGADTTSVSDSTIAARGVAYQYRVIAELKGGTTGQSDPDTGYAIVSTDVEIGSALGDYRLSYDTTAGELLDGGKVWLRFLAQEGWDYEVEVSGSTSIRMLDGDGLEESSSLGAQAGDARFQAAQSGVHYVELDGGQGTVTIRHH